MKKGLTVNIRLTNRLTYSVAKALVKANIANKAVDIKVVSLIKTTNSFIKTNASLMKNKSITLRITSVLTIAT